MLVVTRLGARLIGPRRRRVPEPHKGAAVVRGFRHDGGPVRPRGWCRPGTGVRWSRCSGDRRRRASARRRRGRVRSRRGSCGACALVAGGHPARRCLPAAGRASNSGASPFLRGLGAGHRRDGWSIRRRAGVWRRARVRPHVGVRRRTGFRRCARARRLSGPPRGRARGLRLGPRERRRCATGTCLLRRPRGCVLVTHRLTPVRHRARERAALRWRGGRQRGRVPAHRRGGGRARHDSS